MPTLHVRNVPEPIYEALREAAAENGRSIGAEAINVLTGGLFGRRRRFPRPGPMRRPAGRASFDAAARSAVAGAQDIAHELGHDHVRTEHLLLALAADPAGEVTRLLDEHGVDAASLRERVVAHVGRGDATTAGTLPFGPDAKQALELALRESLRMRCRTIQPLHVFRGLLGAEGAAARVLGDAGAPVAILRSVPSVELRPPSFVRSDVEFRVVELAGTAEEWEGQLNDAAADGYELEQVVGTRAIFRSDGG